MARIRTIKPEFTESESIGRVSREARLLFILLWTICDDSGRLRGDSRKLARTLYPYDDGEDGHFNTTGRDVEGWLQELEAQGCVLRYQHDGSSYLQISNWLKHQKIDKPTPSKLPKPREDSGGLASIREASSLDLVPRTMDQDQDQDRIAPPPPGAPPPFPAEPFITLPTNTGEAWAVYPEMVDDWKKLYPAVDVEQQLRNMRGWCDAKPSRRKTKSGMRAFIANWLSGEQNRGGATRSAAPAKPNGSRLQTPGPEAEYGAL